MAPRSTAAGSSPTQRSLPLRVVSRRRRNVRRNVVVLTAMMAFTLLITLAGRDQQDVRDCRAKLAQAVRDYPRRGEPHSAAAASHYVYRLENLTADAPDGPVGVSCCAAAHRLFLDSDGRHVVIYREQAYEIRWMTETEFQRQAESLGLAEPAD